MQNKSNVAQYVVELNAAIDSRVAYEREQMSKENIFATLDKLRKATTRASIASVFLANNVDAHLLFNRQQRADKRINVYAIDKCENVASAIAKSEALNHFTRALLLTAQSMTKVDSLMTKADAIAACDTSTKLKDAKRDKLIVRTSRHVTASTAATQASSSLDALVTFNVMTKTSDKENNVAYRLNDNETTKALLARVA